MKITNMFHWIKLTNLRRGDIIPCGHWGRGLLHTPLSHPNGTKEILYEYIRREEFSDRPSRLVAVFLCPNMESAINFRQYRKNETLYRVEFVDIDANQFLANWDMMPRKTASYEETLDCAREYWRGGDIPQNLQEIVVVSDVRVLEKVQL